MYNKYLLVYAYNLNSIRPPQKLLLVFKSYRLSFSFEANPYIHPLIQPVSSMRLLGQKINMLKLLLSHD